MAAFSMSGLQGSRSSPSLVTAAAFNLREFSLTRRKISDPTSPDRRMKQTASYEKIDLVGGNGRWRQRKAEQDFARRKVEDAELARQQELRDMEREQRRVDRAEMKRKVKEDEARKRREEQERLLEEAREKERMRWEAQEKDRQRKAEEQADRIRRMPKTCRACSGSGVCQTCEGKGHVFSTYITASVSELSLKQYGKVLQGCESCGGCHQGIRGPLQVGQGKCPECVGYGKIWPIIDEASPVSPKARPSQAWSFMPMH